MTQTPETLANELNAALDNLDAAVAFRRKVTEASERGESVMHNGSFSDALDWLHSAAFRVADARSAIAKQEPKEHGFNSVDLIAAMFRDGAGS